MSEEFWAEAVNHVSYLINISPSISIDLQISEEKWRGQSVDYSTLRIFGCPAYSLVDSQKRNKLESKSKKCIFIGFTKGVKSFRIWDLEKRSTFTSRDVVFDEELMLQESQRQRIECKVELQTIRQTLEKKKLSSYRALKGLKGQKRTPQIQMETNRRILKSNLDH